MTNDFKPAGYPTLMPFLTVQDPEKSIEFYRQVFGFELSHDIIKENGKIQHVEMKLGEGRIMMSPEGAYSSQAKAASSTGDIQGIGLYIYVPNVDEHYAQCMQEGGKITMPVDNMFWGDRMYQVQCLNGYLWSFATKSS